MSQPVHPEMAAILAKFAASPPPDLRTLPWDEARATFNANQASWSWCPKPMASVEEMQVPGGSGPIRARLYRPVNARGLPLILFIHGGGWTFGSVDSHDGTMRMLAAESGAAVLGIDYRLSPQHPFPEPLDDVLASLAFAESGGLGDAIDNTRIALAGDSAGANLALGALIRRRDEGGKMPVTAALIYGCFAPIFDTPSHIRNGDGTFLLRTDMMRWFWRNFLGTLHAEKAPAACAPLNARLDGLPALYLAAAGLDCLLDDTLLLSHLLAETGIEHRLDMWPGVVHGFVRFARELKPARDALAAAGSFLRERLNNNEQGRI